MSSNGVAITVTPTVKHTIKDTQTTVEIAKVSPLLIREITRNFPPPKPPLNPVQYGDHIVMEPNDSDPLYERELAEHNEEVNQKLIQLLIRRGVVVEMTPERLAEVAALRRDMEELGNSELPRDDKYVWVACIAAGSQEDLEELITAITRRSQPHEKVIRENVETFPG